MNKQVEFEFERSTKNPYKTIKIVCKRLAMRTPSTGMKLLMMEKKFEFIIGAGADLGGMTI